MFNTETVIIRTECPRCHCLNHIHTTREQFESWEAGELVQNVFPDLDPTDRESLISGLCPECQTFFFGFEDEE